MKKKNLIAALAVLAILPLATVFGQTRPGATPPPVAAAGGAIPDSKIAVIYSAEFTDPKTGIAKFNVLKNALDKEFDIRKKELDALQTKAVQLNDEIEK